MVEVQIDDAAVVAAHGAATAGLLDEDALDLLKPARDCLAGAPAAAPSVSTLALAAEVVGDQTVTRAYTEFRGALGCRGRPFFLTSGTGGSGSTNICSHSPRTAGPS